MEGYQAQPPPALIPRFWVPGWNSVQSVNHYQTEVGGPLRGGEPGRRLVEPEPGAPPPAFAAPSAAVPRAPQEWLCVPLHHVFGSEELSALAPGVAALAPGAYVALNPEDAGAAGLSAGQEVIVGIGDESHRLTVRELQSLPRGMAGLPAGLAALPWLPFPATARIEKAKAAD
jgi:NADH-quinone oxidoreductase subunit G